MTAQETDSQIKPAEETAASEDRRDSRRKKIVAVVFFSLVILLWLAVHFLSRALTARAVAEPGDPRFVVLVIAPGGSVSDIAQKLVSEGVITNKFLFKVAAAARGSTRDLKSGEYRLDATMSILDVLSRLEQGNVILHEFTIPEGYTIKQIAERLDKLGLAEADEMMRLAENPEFCRKLGVDSSVLEGFLFPDTYKVAKGLSTEELLRIMVNKMLGVWTAEWRSSTVGDRSINDIITIASIIEKEALYDSEKPLVASVIYNRLKKNIPLQCDVTIRYPLDNYGVHLTYDDLEMDSPYNTYLYRGIPPTPICNPGLLAVRAAINPAETDYLYFVHMNNGRHKFSVTLKEHNKAVYKYQILNERG
jgi:UPF0755 protein